MLKLTLTAACMAALMLTPAAAKELKLADFQPPTHFVVPEAYDAFAKAIAEGTGNAVTVTVYMGGELGAGPAEQYTRAVENVTDIAFGLPGYTA
ncbi:MAG: ABC transporter substrate-binding protein, partial [Gemmobacter sp.]